MNKWLKADASLLIAALALALSIITFANSTFRERTSDARATKIRLILPMQYLEPHQYGKVAMYPDMILQLAHHIAQEWRRQGHPNASVRVLIGNSLNGRPMQQLIDQDVNLAAQRRSLLPAKWILPLTTPYRPPEQRPPVVGKDPR